MTDISQLAAPLPRDLDGFRIEIDAARERGDIILDRPPLNIITMPQREQLRIAFEALDADPAVSPANHESCEVTVAVLCKCTLTALGWDQRPLVVAPDHGQDPVV